MNHPSTEKMIVIMTLRLNQELKILLAIGSGVQFFEKNIFPTISGHSTLQRSYNLVVFSTNEASSFQCSLYFFIQHITLFFWVHTSHQEL
jgi:hypothetical protein